MDRSTVERPLDPEHPPARLGAPRLPGGRVEPVRAAEAHPPVDVRPVLVPVTVAATILLALSGLDLAGSRPGLGTLAGAGALLVASVFADRHPVPLRSGALGGISLAAIFIVGAGLLYGPWWACLVGGLARAIVELSAFRSHERLLYNTAVYAVSGATSLAVFAIDEASSASATVSAVAQASIAFWLTNVFLVSLIAARTRRAGALPDLVATLRETVLPFAITASGTLLLVILWQRSPWLSPALAGPLVAVAAYQVSTARAYAAVQLAMTDVLTGLGNRRALFDALEREVQLSRSRLRPLCLCLIDVDDFKDVNDRFGHPVGDEVLARVATTLSRHGKAFRLGGDEFALLLPGLGEQAGRTVARGALAELTATRYAHGEPLGVSVGVASLGAHGDRDEFLREVDAALYQAKEHGKGRIWVRGERSETGGAEVEARLRVATSLAGMLDAFPNDASLLSADELAEQIGGKLGMADEQIVQLSLAARLRDVGTVTLPHGLLHKPEPLTASERAAIRQHPVAGANMLEALGVEHVASWVRHHHERFDGAGYPDGLAADAIPLGARILCVADAYHAMTSDRAHSGRISHDAALRELARCAGTQFDPLVVAVAAEVLGSALAA